MMCDVTEKRGTVSGAHIHAQAQTVCGHLILFLWNLTIGYW